MSETLEPALPQELDDRAEKLMRALEEGARLLRDGAVETEYRIIRPDGEMRWLRDSKRIVRDEAGRALHIGGIATDITERRRAEKALAVSEDLHRATLANISDAVFVTDEAGTFTYVCPNAMTIFGRTREEILALGSIHTLLGPDRFEQNALREQGELENLPYEVEDKAGAAHDLLVNVKRVAIHGGTRLYTCRDVTERRRVRAALDGNPLVSAMCVRNSAALTWLGRQSCSGI